MCRSLLCALALALGLAAACNRATFRVADMQARFLDTPYDTIDYFRYAMREREWDAVYDTLSTKTQEWLEEKYLGRFGFRNFAESRELADFDLRIKVPAELREMKLVELIHRASVLSVEISKDYSTATVYLRYGRLSPQAVPLLNEKTKDGKDRWTVGIYEWVGP